MDHDPSMIFDDDGRLERWVKERRKPELVPKGCCGKALSKLDSELKFVEDLDAFEKRLFDNLEVRQRAIKNWHKLRILIVLIIICNGGEIDDAPTALGKKRITLPERAPTCKERFAPYIIRPSHKYKLAWDAVIGFLYLVSYFVDTYTVAFWF